MKTFAFAFVLLLSLPAFADEGAAPHGKAGHAGPCAADRQKFCSGIKPGGGGIVKCLAEHQSELSEGCKKMAENMKKGARHHGAHPQHGKRSATPGGEISPSGEPEGGK